MIEVIFISLIAILCLYTMVAIFSFDGTSSPAGFFNVSSSLRSTFSMAFGGVTLGTGFAYLAVAGSQLGILAFIAPFGVLFGYLSLSRFEKQIKIYTDNNPKSVSLELNFAKIDNQNFIDQKIILIFNLMKIVCFAAILAFELWVSSKYVSSLLGFDLNSTEVFFISFLFSAFVTICTTIGGFPAALKTDILQGIAVIFLLLILCLKLYWSIGTVPNTLSSLSASLIEQTPEIKASTYWTFLAIFLTAFSTQFYNVINVVSSRTRPSKENSKNYLNAGKIQFIIFVVVICIGTLSAATEFKSIEFLLASIGNDTSTFGIILAVITTIGLTAILFTTADSLLVALTAYSGEVFGLNLESTKNAIWPRLFAFSIGLIILPLTMIFLYLDLGVVETLLMILTPLGGISLYIYSNIFLKIKGVNITSENYLNVICILFILVCFLIAIYSQFFSDGAFVTHSNIMSCIPGTVIYLWGCIKAKGLT